MPGKAGPEYIKIRRGSIDNFLLTGSLPLPKPSYSTPRRASFTPVRSLSSSAASAPSHPEHRRASVSGPFGDFKDTVAFANDQTKSVDSYFDKNPQTLASGDSSDAFPLPLTPVPTDSVAKKPPGLLSGRDRLRLIEEQENDEEAEDEASVVEEFAEFHKTRSLFESMASRDGSHVNTTVSKEDSEEEVHPTLHQSQASFNLLTQTSSIDTTADITDSRTKDNNSEKHTQGSTVFVSQAKGLYQQDNMTSSYEELRDLTSSGGRDLGRPPHQARDSVFNTISSTRQSSLQARSSLRTTTSSLPGSRGASPNPDAMSTGRRSAMGADMRSYIVDKEVVESQLRKLKAENASLQSENKLLKEKYNRAQTRIQSLESQLLSSQGDGVDSSDIEYIKKSKELNDYDRQLLEEKIEKLTREVQMLKSENASLERQLAANKLTSSTHEHAGDRSLVIASFRTELAAVREEMSKVKLILEQAERDRHDETEKRKEASTKVVKLTEMKALLQQQLEGSGGGVAEKQVKSLEKRLKLTEDRLHQERADRAGKLSQVEEKLIHENAQLQVTEKELKRQLQREQDKNRNLDLKYKDCREENDKMRVIVADKMPSDTRWSSLRDSLSGRQQVRAELESSEEKADHYKHLYEDCKHERNTLENTLTSQIKTLVQDKHSAQAKIHNLEDLNAALVVERDTLHSTSKLSTISTLHKHDHTNTFEGEVESLKTELRTARAELQQQLRHNKLLEAESESMRVQLLAKDGALNEALDELSRGNRTAIAERDAEKYQHQTELLNTQKLSMESRLEERDQEILKLTVDSNEKENAMKRCKQSLSKQQQQTEEKVAQMEQLQLQLRQKTRLLEQMGGAEASHQVEMTSLKQNLNECNQQLSKYENELKSKTVELNRMNTLVQSMEHELKDKYGQFNTDIPKPLNDGFTTESSNAEALTHAESQVLFFQSEIERLKRQVQSGNEAVEEVIQENTELLSRLRETQQNLVQERAQLCQLTCEKVEIDQRLNISEEENASLVTEKTKLEQALSKHEHECSRLISEIEREAGQTDFQHKYAGLDGAGKQAVTELMTCRKLLDARAREIELLKETIERQKHEISSLNYKMAVLKEESANSQKDFDRLSNHWTTQIKESASDESMQALANERTKLQLEKLKLEKDVHKDHEQVQTKTFEITSLQKKLEKANEQQRRTEKELHEKENQLVALETELRHQNKNVTQLETEKSEMKSQMIRIQEELHNMSDLNSTLEQRLTLEKSSLTKEKSDRDYLNDELDQSERHLDNLKREHDIVVNNLEKEKQIVQTLKAENVSLRGQLETLKQDLTGKNKRLSLEMRQNSENYDKDRNKLVAQAEQLSSDLDTAREQAAVKNRENLQLKEQILALEGHLRETTTDVKQLKDSLTLEEQTRDKLDKRNMELELLVAKIRSKESDITYDTNRAEVQKMLNELSKKMQDQLENQKGSDSELLAKERKKIEELKKKLACIESQLNQEQAMHIVSKTQLQSLEDENQRLRTQITSLRRRLANASHNESDRNKSRIEEINEIIAKSQNRARQMLAAGNYNPMDNDPLKLNTSFNPLQLDLSTQSNLPNSQYWRMTSSPRPQVDGNRSLGSDDVSLGVINCQ